MNNDMLKIDSEFHSLIPSLTQEEYIGLEASILSDGCRDAILVWLHDSQLVIVDGHNRYEICTKHGLPYDTRTMIFDTRELAKEWIIRNQFGRRNLSAFQRSELALQLKPILSIKAKENLITSTGGSNPQPLENSPKVESINTRSEIARIAGVSDNTIARVEKIKLEARPEQIERIVSGEVI